MNERISKAEEISGAVTPKSLRAVLTTPAWEPLSHTCGSLSKLLLSDAFNTQGMSAQKIDVRALRCFALLHCQGEPKEKANALLEIIEGFGELLLHKVISNDKERHKEISNDKEKLKPIFA